MQVVCTPEPMMNAIMMLAFIAGVIMTLGNFLDMLGSRVSTEGFDDLFEITEEDSLSGWDGRCIVCGLYGCCTHSFVEEK